MGSTIFRHKYFPEDYVMTWPFALLCSQMLMLLSASHMYGVLRSTSLCFLMIDGQPRILEVKELWVQSQ
jgi:hypothetical protein